ncbi:MAG: ABC transporter permease subunit [Oscillospiraceae bacterium]
MAVTLVDPLGQVGAIVVALLLGAALGYLNGVVLTGSGAVTQAEVLFITYGMSSVFMAIGLLFTNAETLRLMRSTKPITIFETLSSTVGIVPVIVIVFVVLLVVMHIFLNKTLAGRSVTLLGGNKDAAYLCGFNALKRAMRMILFHQRLACSPWALIALVSRVTTATATCGTGYETNAILSALSSAARP